MLDDLDKTHKEMIKILEGISVDDITTKNGVSIQVGNKIFKFNGLEVIPSDNIESIIRNEFRDLINDQQQKIREKINQKIGQLMTMYNQKQNELTRKENELVKKYSNAANMPEIGLSHIDKGISVCKAETGFLNWIYRGVYNPKFINMETSTGRMPLDTRIIARLKQDIFFVIKTKGANVIEVSTRKINDSCHFFDHYHQASPDCWGSWKPPTTWKTVDDILKIAKDAEAVLESINRRSVAQRNPIDMPRIETLEEHLLERTIENHPNKDNIVEPIKRGRGRPRTRPQEIPMERMVMPLSDVWST